MAVAPLPPALEHRLVALAGRVRRQRVVRGACLTAAALALALGAVLALDAAAGLSAGVRGLLLAWWAALAAGLVGLLVIRPARAAVGLPEIATRIEDEFPGLAERLRTVVELRDHAEPGNGSPALIAALARDTDLRTRDMDFARTAPARRVAGMAAAAVATPLAAAVLVAVSPGPGERLRRVFAPWYRPAVPDPFRVVVSSGDPVVKRGDPVTLSAYVERLSAETPVPDAALLAFRDSPAGPERKLPMTPDARGAFHVTRPGVAADFEYRVQVGPVQTAWHAVAVIDPVELADGTVVEITPPAYAAAAFPAKKLPGLADLDGVRHSTAVLDLRFTRDAASAFLEWKPDGGPVTLIPLTLGPGRTAATARFPLATSGALRLVTTAEANGKAVRTEAATAVRVAADAPPRFEQVAGLGARPRTVRPGEKIPVHLVVGDDIAVGRAEVEFAAGPNPRVAVELAGAGTPRAEGNAVLDLAGRGAEGDTVRVRVRVWDTRSVTPPPLNPQEAVFPPAGWAEFHLSQSAPPLREQEILGQRDALRDALAAALKDVRQAGEETARLGTETAGKPGLSVDQTVRLGDARDRARSAAAAVHAAARDAALTPETRPLAAAVRDVADRPLKEADDLLAKAVKASPADRDPALTGAAKALATAAAGLEELLARNDRLARDRLDRGRLDGLAADQRALADRAATDGAAELARRQQELLARLAALLADSDPLRNALAGLSARNAEQAAKAAQDLAGMQRELGAAAKQAAADARRDALAALARKQADVTARAADFHAKSAAAARMAGATVPADALKTAADRVAAGKLLDAQAEQEQAAAGLDRLAEAFERWAAERRDPKAAAKQLARWETDLRGRLAEATRVTSLPSLPESARAAFQQEQRAVRGAAERLSLPPDEPVKAARTAALDALRAATDALGGDGDKADTTTKAAADALDNLAAKTPSAAERLARSFPALAKLRAEQDSIALAADQALRNADPAATQPTAKKLEPTAARQEKLLADLAALDLPTLEPRRDRVLDTLRTAVADMKAGRPFDAVASQLAAKRELDRLKQAADGIAPADEVADQFAGKQRALADAVEALGPNPPAKAVAPFAERQRDITRQVLTLQAPESPTLQHLAREAAKAADAAFKDAKPADPRAATRAAADALDRLADRTAGAEPDAARVARLAADRRKAAAGAKAFQGKPASADVSNEAARQLQRELDDLANTRVGGAQPTKKAVLDLYAQLKAMAEPERKEGTQKAVADALDKLRLAMAGDAGLAATRPRTPEAEPADPDSALPTRETAAAARELARLQREARESTGRAEADLARSLQPAATNPLAALEKEQREIAAGVTELAKSLAADRGAEATARAAESARTAADKLRVGLVPAAQEAGTATARGLRGFAAVTARKPAAAVADALVERQERVLAALKGAAGPGAGAAAQQARQEELAKKAWELAHALEHAGKGGAMGDAAAKAMAAAADDAKAAAKAMDEAAKKPDAADPLRAAADKSLADAAAKLAAAMPAPELRTAGPDAEADPAAARAVRDADAAMRAAEQALGGKKPDAGAAGAAMTAAADALSRAAKATGGAAPPAPESAPGNPGRESGANAGTQTGPTTQGDISPDLAAYAGKPWGEIPGELRSKIVQDLKAKYGDDYARVIKLYFEQLAERK